MVVTESSKTATKPNQAPATPPHVAAFSTELCEGITATSAATPTTPTTADDTREAWTDMIDASPGLPRTTKRAARPAMIQPQAAKWRQPGRGAPSIVAIGSEI